MNDILVVINLPETIKKQVLIVEFYHGKIKLTKNGIFSGPIKKADLNQIFDCDNLTSIQLKRLKTIVLDKTNSQIQKFRHVISQESSSKLLVYINDYAVNCFFCFANDYKYHKINQIIIEDISGLRNNSYQTEIDFINNPKFLLIKDVLKIITNIINKTSDNPDEVLAHKSLYGNNLATVVNPIPIIYLKTEPHKLVGSVYFRYNDIEISSNSLTEIINDDGKLYYRDLDTEHAKSILLIEAGWNKSAKNVVFYKGSSIDDIVDNLINYGYKVFLENKKEVLHSSNVQYNMSYNIDWFTLDAQIVINNQIHNLADLIDLKGRKKNYLEIENTIVFLPGLLTKNISNIHNRNGRLAIERKNFVNAIQLSKSLGIENINNINDFLKSEDVIINIPDSLKEKLRSYQYNGAKWIKCLYNNSFGGCLADDMGLGKTIQVIAFLSEKDTVSSDKCNVVIVPKSLIYNWERELKKFAPEIRVDIYHGQNRNIKECFQANYTVLTTYGTILNDLDTLKEIEIGCLILDEIQNIKNSISKTYKAVSQLNAQFKLGLSGTPFENNIGELWSIMNILNEGILGHKNDFLRKYSQIAQDKSISDELKQIIKPFILRRNKKDVLIELPPKTEQSIYCGMTEKQNELYTSLHLQIQQQLTSAPSRFEIKGNAMILQGLLYLRQVACHPKLLKKELNVNDCFESEKFEVFKLKTEEIMANKGKLVVFSQFTTMLKIMEQWIKQKKWKYFYLDGSTSKRQEVVDAFEQAGSGIFLISLKAGGVGLNLVSSQYAFIYDPWWNPAVENQAADRIYRIGQKNKVFIYRFITVGSVEEKIQQLKSVKSDISENLLNGLDKPSNIDINELRKILL